MKSLLKINSNSYQGLGGDGGGSWQGRNRSGANKDVKPRGPTVCIVRSAEGLGRKTLLMIGGGYCMSHKLHLWKIYSFLPVIQRG